MRRRPVLVLAGAGAVLAALSACSGTAQTGAAAVVGGQRISVSTLEAQVADYRAAVGQATAAAAVEQTGQGDSQRTLDLLIEARLAQSALERAGLTVTQGEVDRTVDGLAQQYGGRAAVAGLLAKNGGLPPEDLDLWVRRGLAHDKLLQASGVDLNDQTAARRSWVQLLTQEAGRLGVKVNPRYGSWQAGTQSIGPANRPWLKSA